MASLKKLIPHQKVYSISKTKMGNTTLSTTSVHIVRIVEVHDTYVIASWNDNTPRRFSAREAQKWRLGKPFLVTGGFGSHRLATRQEIADAESKESVVEYSSYFSIK